MKKEKEVKISYWAAHATTIVSVTLVLLILGIISLISVGARNETSRIRESLEISVIMADSVSNDAAQAQLQEISARPWCINPRLITKEQALADWKKETGEDLEALFGVNPLSPEISFNIPENYSVNDSIRKIEVTLTGMPGVESVATPQGETVDMMNKNITRLGTILGAIAIVLLIISFVLINNTVHLTIYARRFTIHTMQLVGATNGFICRPFVLRNLIAGGVAGLIASIVLICVYTLAHSAGFEELRRIVSVEYVAVICACLIIIGALLCSIAASIATRHYLHKDYDELFK